MSEQPPRQINVFECPGGFWFHGNDQPQTPTSCEPVGAGFYSPSGDLARYPCTPGTFSNVDTAFKCMDCAPGSFNPYTQATKCLSCPRSTYAIEESAQECVPCNDLYYKGIASDYAIYLSGQQTGLDAGDLFCLEPLEGPVYAAPTTSPTPAPTVSIETPTATPTLSPSIDTTTLFDSSTTTPTNTESTKSLTMAPSMRTTWTPTMSSSSTRSSKFPTTPPRPDSLFDVPQTAPTVGISSDATVQVSSIWLPIFLALVVAAALGLVVVWVSMEGAEDEDDDDDSSEKGSNESTSGKEVDPSLCGSRARSTSHGSASTLFIDELADFVPLEDDECSSLPHFKSKSERGLESGASLAGGGGVASIWSMSVGLRSVFDDSSNSDASEDDILST